MDMKYTQIRDLEHGMKGLRLVFIVLDVGRPVTTKENHEVRSCKVADRTGCINISLWDEPGQLLMPGDIVQLTKGYVSVFKSCLTLYVGKGGDLQKVSEFCMQFVEQPNMSEANPELAALNKNSGGGSTGGGGGTNTNSNIGQGQGTNLGSGTTGPGNGPGNCTDTNNSSQNNVLTNNSNNRMNNDPRLQKPSSNGGNNDPRLQKPSSNGGNNDPRGNKGGGNSTVVASNGHATNAPSRNANSGGSNKSRGGNNSSMNRPMNKR